MRSLTRFGPLLSCFVALALCATGIAQPTLPSASVEAITKNSTTSNLTASFNTGNRTITVNTGGSIAFSGTGTVAGDLPVSGNLTVSGTGTSSFTGNVSANGVSGSIGQATTSNRYMDVGSTTEGQTVGYNLGVFDGANNYRSSFFLDDAAGVSGINVNRSAGTPQVQLQVAGVPRFIGTTTGSAVFGTTTNDNAATGYVGEYVSSTVAFGSRVSLTTDTSANITSISLTAGDWDVDCSVIYVPEATTVRLLSLAGASTLSANLPADELQGRVTYSTADSSANRYTVVPVTQRISLSGTTTVYLVARAGFTSGTLAAHGMIRARRVR